MGHNLLSASNYGWLISLNSLHLHTQESSMMKQLMAWPRPGTFYTSLTCLPQITMSLGHKRPQRLPI